MGSIHDVACQHLLRELIEYIKSLRELIEYIKSWSKDLTISELAQKEVVSKLNPPGVPQLKVFGNN